MTLRYTMTRIPVTCNLHPLTILRTNITSLVKEMVASKQYTSKVANNEDLSLHDANRKCKNPLI